MLSIRLDKDIEAEISDISAKINKSKSSIIREAIIDYIEDLRDYLDALKAFDSLTEKKAKGEKATYTLEELKEKYSNVLQD